MRTGIIVCSTTKCLKQVAMHALLLTVYSVLPLTRICINWKRYDQQFQLLYLALSLLAGTHQYASRWAEACGKSCTFSYMSILQKGVRCHSRYYSRFHNETYHASSDIQKIQRGWSGYDWWNCFFYASCLMLDCD